MSIKASVYNVESFYNGVQDLQNDFDISANKLLSICNLVHKSITNFRNGIEKNLSLINEDLSNADYWLYRNESLYAKMESKKDYAEKRLKAVQDETDISNYNKTIAECENKMEEISKKNANLNSIISHLRQLQNNYSELLKKLPKTETVDKIEKNLDQIKSSQFSLCSKYQNFARTAQQLIAEIDRNLSYIADVPQSNGRIVSINNSNALLNMSKSLQDVSDGVSNQNGGFLGEISTFSSIIQDEVTENAISFCKDSAQNVSNMVDNFYDLAEHFEKAAKTLKQYENLL